MTPTLPVIDLNLLDDPEREASVLAQWNDAFCNHGFCYLTSKSHGLQPLYERVEREALQFFTTLTPEEKAAYYLKKGYGHGGYVAPGIESVASSRHAKKSPPDLVESLCVHSSRAQHVPPFRSSDDMLEDVPYKHGDGFEQAVQDLWKGLDELLGKIMTLSAKALQLPDLYFHQFFQPTGANFMRLAHYVDDNSKDALRYGEHTDYQGFTFLWRNQSNGLQCASNLRHCIERNEEIEKWIDVPILQDDLHAVVVNAGDLIQRWTNDYWISNVHRVVKKNSKTSREKESLSIVFFTGPVMETKVEKLPSPLLENQESKYSPVTAGEHLKMKIEPTSTTSRQ